MVKGWVRLLSEFPYSFPKIVSYEELEYSFPFVLTGLAATSQNTVVVGTIPFTFRVLEITVFFPDDAINNIQVYFLVSDNPQGSTTTIPSGENLLAPFTPTQFLIGHAEKVTITCNALVSSNRSYIKMHIINNNTYAITLMGIVKIRKSV